MQPIYSFTFSELKETLISKGFPGYSAKQIFGWIYKKKAEDFSSMTNISKKDKSFLKKIFCFPKPTLVKKQRSLDKTEKFLFRLEDASMIEAVLIPEGRRSTLCVSTQVGCKFRCLFCASGESGFLRNLETDEIISQFLEVSKKHKITNIVFMGIGEPLDNFKNLMKAINILKDSSGLAMSRGKICVSSCGLISEINQLRELNLDIKLSISLHSADEETRTKLMPINKKYPLSRLIPCLRDFSKSSKYPITFEYVLINNLNSDKKSAQKLIKLIKAINCKVNLIPYNGISNKFKAPDEESTLEFISILREKGIFSTFRKSRGQDIKAACGQLKASMV